MSTKQIVLEHDPVAGDIKDAAGMLVASWIGNLSSFETGPSSGITPNILVQLKKGGYTAKDIIQLRRDGIL